MEVVFECLTSLPLSAANDMHLSSGPKEYLGMLEYKREDEAKLIQNLILGSETWNSEFLLSFELEHQPLPIVLRAGSPFYSLTASCPSPEFLSIIHVEQMLVILC